MPARVGVSPAPVPPPVTEHIVVAPQPVRPGKSPLSRMSSSSSSSASTTTARHSSSIHSSPGRTKLDPRMDSSSGGDSRSHYSRLFKKRKDQLNEEGTASNISMRIEIESPVRPQQFSTFRLADPDATSLNQTSRLTRMAFLLSTLHNLRSSARVISPVYYPETRPHRHRKRQGGIRTSHLWRNSRT